MTGLCFAGDLDEEASRTQVVNDHWVDRNATLDVADMDAPAYCGLFLVK